MRFRSPRRPTDYPAELVVSGEAHAVEIREISQSGLKLMVPSQAAVDDVVEHGECSLKVLNCRLQCRLRWHHDSLAGFEFISPPPRHLADQIRRSGRSWGLPRP